MVKRPGQVVMDLGPGLDFALLLGYKLVTIVQALVQSTCLLGGTLQQFVGIEQVQPRSVDQSDISTPFLEWC